MIDRPYKTTSLRTTLLALVLALAGCASTGNDNRPIHVYGWRVYIFGHEKYTPSEAAYERCVYRNRLPDNSRSGFRRECRMEAAQYTAGINAAMYTTGCIMEKCHRAVDHLPNDLPR